MDVERLKDALRKTLVIVRWTFIVMVVGVVVWKVGAIVIRMVTR